ncbi:histone acetyltransferase [Paenibacillus sp. E194]|uniref:GNAT family N-acetyltransferase n=1 Tax=Paenibacillus sp. E194 TaxID=1458845 RepID=UPI0005CAE3A4|nr:GNAT family N-acetyltransferase [Paenibacillus sp. E194]KJB88412.1 histone acetyltransferase [Paenibacillus sp. E194]
MKYTIRPIMERDISFLWITLYESLYVPEGKESFSRDIINEPSISKYVEDWGREGDLGYIAENADGESIGSITVRYFSEDKPGYGFVSSEVPELGMAILPIYRGQGLGTSLMKQLFAGLREQRVDQVSLSVDPGNAAAMKLYQHFGFKPLGEVGTSITMLAQVNRV